MFYKKIKKLFRGLMAFSLLMIFSAIFGIINFSLVMIMIARTDPSTTTITPSIAVVVLSIILFIINLTSGIGSLVYSSIITSKREQMKQNKKFFLATSIMGIVSSSILLIPNICLLIPFLLVFMIIPTILFYIPATICLIVVFGLSIACITKCNKIADNQ